MSERKRCPRCTSKEYTRDIGCSNCGYEPGDPGRVTDHYMEFAGKWSKAINENWVNNMVTNIERDQ